MRWTRRRRCARWKQQQAADEETEHGPARPPRQVVIRTPAAPIIVPKPKVKCSTVLRLPCRWGVLDDRVGAIRGGTIRRG